MAKDGKGNSKPQKHKQKETVAAASSNKQDERAKKRELRKQQAKEKDYQSKEERAFAALLQQQELCIKYMDGDGNCLFRSIADQLTGRQDLHMDIRHKTMDYISQHEEHFRLFMEDDESMDDYLARMRSPREWGGHQELYAASQVQYSPVQSPCTSPLLL